MTTSKAERIGAALDQLGDSGTKEERQTATEARVTIVFRGDKAHRGKRIEGVSPAGVPIATTVREMLTRLLHNDPRAQGYTWRLTAPGAVDRHLYIYVPGYVKGAHAQVLYAHAAVLIGGR